MPNRKLIAVAGASVIALSMLGCGPDNKPQGPGATAPTPPPPRVATGPDNPSGPPPAAIPEESKDPMKRSEPPSPAPESPKRY